VKVLGVLHTPALKVKVLGVCNTPLHGIILT